MAFRHRGTYVPQAPGKDPNSRLDYSVDWSAHLEAGETITQSSWTIPDGLQGSGTAVNGAVATVWLVGGTASRIYRVTNRVTTSKGRTVDRSMMIPCREQ